jgi:hypothetical protein
MLDAMVIKLQLASGYTCERDFVTPFSERLGDHFVISRRASAYLMGKF